MRGVELLAQNELLIQDFYALPLEIRLVSFCALNRQSREREVVSVSRVSFDGGRKRAAQFLVAGFEAVAEVDQDRQWDLDRRPLTGAIGVQLEGHDPPRRIDAPHTVGGDGAATV